MSAAFVRDIPFLLKIFAIFLPVSIMSIRFIFITVLSSSQRLSMGEGIRTPEILFLRPARLPVAALPYDHGGSRTRKARILNAVHIPVLVHGRIFRYKNIHTRNRRSHTGKGPSPCRMKESNPQPFQTFCRYRLRFLTVTLREGNRNEYPHPDSNRECPFGCRGFLVRRLFLSAMRACNDPGGI